MKKGGKRPFDGSFDFLFYDIFSCGTLLCGTLSCNTHSGNTHSGNNPAFSTLSVNFCNALLYPQENLYWGI